MQSLPISRSAEQPHLQELDISDCRGIEEQGMCAIAALTQLTSLGAEGLHWLADPSDVGRDIIQEFLHALTGTASLCCISDVHGMCQEVLTMPRVLQSTPIADRLGCWKNYSNVHRQLSQCCKQRPAHTLPSSLRKTLCGWQR